MTSDVDADAHWDDGTTPPQSATPITLFEREDGRRSIAYGARKDETVLAEDGTRQHNRAVKVVWLSGDLSFEAIRQAYANAESVPGTASGWLGGES